MKKQKTTKKGISKAKATKKADAKKEKKELIRALSGKPAKPQKKTPAKKAAKTKKTVAVKKILKKTTAKKIKPAAKKPAQKTKTTKAKTTTKVKTVKKAVAKAAPKKPVKKALAKKAVVKKITVRKPVKKLPPKKAVKPVKKEIKKPLEELTVAELKTLAKELGISLKTGFKKADIIKAISKPEAKTIEKPAPEKAKPEKAKKPVLKPVSKKAAAVKKIVTAEKPIKAEERKPLPPEKYVEMPPLPVGYDADKAVSMPVTPRQLYVYWEITEQTLSKYIGSLNIKVTNLKTKAFFYTPISERIGEEFLTVAPEGEYAVEIGVIDYKGIFVPIVKSLPTETPVSGMAQKEAKKEKAEETELPEEFFETPESISSY